MSSAIEPTQAACCRRKVCRPGRAVIAIVGRQGDERATAQLDRVLGNRLSPRTRQGSYSNRVTRLFIPPPSGTKSIGSGSAVSDGNRVCVLSSDCRKCTDRDVPFILIFCGIHANRYIPSPLLVGGWIYNGRELLSFFFCLFLRAPPARHHRGSSRHSTHRRANHHVPRTTLHAVL
jgi:hypothetical protein